MSEPLPDSLPSTPGAGRRIVGRRRRGATVEATTENGGVSGLPPALCRALTLALGAEPTRAAPLSGGMISRAARVDTRQGAVFVKWNPDAPPGLFEAEAHGLRLLGRAGALRVPGVLALRPETAAAPPFLALEFVEPSRPHDLERFARDQGEGLARLHRENQSPDGRFGLDHDNYLGRLPQRNAPAARWPDFYRDSRLLPQMETARRAGKLPPARERALMGVLARLESLLDGLESAPCLLHGDLWGGNYIVVGAEAVLIDPAAYYGEREMELAYMELFGGFAPGVFGAYRAAFPLSPGYERRRPLHQLYHLLNHLNHFGEGYGPDVDAACRRLGVGG